MAERETKELKTTGGHTVVYFAHLKGREFLEVAKKDRQGNDTAQGIDKALDLMGKAIVSVDGSTDKPVELVQDFDLEDYLEVTKAISAIAGNFQTAK